MGDSEYVVEKVLKDRPGKNGDREYLIKWKDFAKLSWEPSSNLTNCKHALKAFHSVSFLKKNLEMLSLYFNAYIGFE